MKSKNCSIHFWNLESWPTGKINKWWYKTFTGMTVPKRGGANSARTWGISCSETVCNLDQDVLGKFIVHPFRAARPCIMLPRSCFPRKKASKVASSCTSTKQSCQLLQVCRLLFKNFSVKCKNSHKKMSSSHVAIGERRRERPFKQSIALTLS